MQMRSLCYSHKKTIFHPTVRKHECRHSRIVLKAHNSTYALEDYSEKDMYSMFDKMLKDCVVGYKIGDKVSGKVVAMDKRSIYVDMGLKDYALLPRREVSLIEESAEEVLPVGESRVFLVTGVSKRDAQLTVSRAAVEREMAWDRVRQQIQTNAVIESLVVEAVKGGYKLNVEGLKSFLPASQICPQYLIGELVGRTISVKLIDVDESKNRCVCSNRKAMVEDDEAISRLAGLKVGDVVSGYIQNVTGFGAFVDLNGIAGLLHISQISNDRINTTEGLFQIGEPIKSMVLAVDEERGRLSLTTKKLEPSPGDMIRNRGMVMERAEEMALLFRERVAAAEAVVMTTEKACSAIKDTDEDTQQ
jgi:small subunit ribosomal protein S1